MATSAVSRDSCSTGPCADASTSTIYIFMNIAAESTWSAGVIALLRSASSASKRPRVMRPYHRLCLVHLISHVLSSMRRG